MSPVDSVPPIAAGVGADLRAAREAAGWSLPQLATHLRIRLPYLEALEGGRIGLLPGNAYAVAFMRSYAQALGLDPEEIVRRFRCEAAEVNRRTELEFPAPLPERGIPAGAIVVVGLVIAIAGYAVWWRGGGAPAPAPRVAEVPAHLAVIAEQPVIPPPQATLSSQAAGTSLPATPITQASAVAAAPAVPAASAAGPQTAGSPQSVASAATAPTPAATRPAPPVPDISPASAAAATAPNPTAGTFASASPDSPAIGPNTVVIGATADAWLEVRSPSGQILLNKVLHKGETWPVPDEPGLVLTTGNAGGTSITLGDVALASLGTDGMVRHNLPLDPAVIRAGGLASAAAPPKQGAPKTN
jgi:cytoskeleton protein RodZ